MKKPVLKENSPVLIAAAILFSSFCAAETWITPLPTWDRPPYTYIDERGSPQGIDIAIINDIFDRVGLTAEYKTMSFIDRQTQFISGDIVVDCCIAEAWRQSPDDLRIQLLTDPIYQGIEVYIHPEGQVFTIHQDQLSLIDKKVGTIKGYTYRNEEMFGERVDYSSQSELLAAVSAAEVDVAILDRHVAAFHAAKMGLAIEYGAIHQQFEVSLRLHNSKADFLPLINSAIHQMKSENRFRSLIKEEAQRAKLKSGQPTYLINPVQ